MSTITERFHNKRFNMFGIKIKTKFQDGSQVKEVNSDDSSVDNINSGVILNKTYYKDNKVIYAENEFNPSLLYSLVLPSELEKDYTCSNCGIHAKGKDFKNGCPYCGSIYNIEYSNKNIASKKNFNYIQKDNKYKIITFFVDFVICLAFSSIYWLSFGRTTTIFDILKIFGLALVSSLLLYYPFYMFDSYLINSRIIREKEKEHKKQSDFWDNISKHNISKEKFFNNLNSELNEYYYDNSIEKNQNVIDYDVMEYNDYDFYIDDLGRVNIIVKMEVRVISIDNKGVHPINETLNLTLVQNEIKEDEYHTGMYLAKCHGCGASIDILKSQCEYCGAKIHYLQSWYINKIEAHNI